MAGIEIVPAKGLPGFLAFSRLPRLLYKGAAGFAPPLDIERWTLHGHALNPHFKLVEAQEFLARGEGKLVGRVMAQVYKPEHAPRGASRFQFGSLDAIDDVEVVRALTQSAERWLAARGADRVNGPFSPSINGECGMLVQGFDATPMFLTPWHPPYLSRHLEQLGYVKARDLYSYRFDITQADIEKPSRILQREEWKRRLKLRPLDLANLKTVETPLLTELFNDAWRDNWGFTPFTLEEFNSIADALKYVMPADYGIIIELDGEPVSFVIALPNLFEIISDFGGKLSLFKLPKLLSRIRHHRYAAARIVLLGTRKALQNSATGGVILLAVIDEMRRRGARASIHHLEAGWVLEDNIPMRRPIELFGGKLDKVHRIYEKPLEHSAQEGSGR